MSNCLKFQPFMEATNILGKFILFLQNRKAMNILGKSFLFCIIGKQEKIGKNKIPSHKSIKLIT